MKIFISYRRQDSADVTGRINDRLREKFGTGAIFTDVDSIPIGVDFREHLDHEVTQCDILLAVIGRSWTTVKGDDGERRLDHPSDFVRIEIESAMNRKIPVVPLLAHGVAMPTEDELPESIKALAFRNGTTVRPDPDFHKDMDRLIGGLEKFFADQDGESPVAETAEPAPGTRVGASRPANRGNAADRLTESTRAAKSLSTVRSGRLKRYGLALVVLLALATGSWVYVDKVAQERATVAAQQARDRSASIAAEKERAGVAAIAAQKEQERLTAIAVEKERERLAAIAVEKERKRERLAAIELEEERKRRIAEAKAERQAALAETKRLAVAEAERLAVAEAKRLAELPQPGTTFEDCSVCPEMVVIPASKFRMGSQTTLEGHYEDQVPVHDVEVAAFALGKYEVTFAEWDACVEAGGCGYRPGDKGWGRGNYPVINVSWHDANIYARWLSSATGRRYRLPTEAEWEYAARAGTSTRYWWGDADVSNQANCSSCADVYIARTTPVGKYAANPFKLYDMVGNVGEWVQDCYHDSYVGAPNDGKEWAEVACKRRVTRGGGWGGRLWMGGAAVRGSWVPDGRGDDHGFRIARTL